MHLYDFTHLSHLRTVRASALFMVVAMFASLLWACSGDDPESGATVHGVVTDNDGTQKSALGGAGTLASATSVQASKVDANGGLELLAEAELAVDGSYEIVLPPDSTRVVLQAVDDAGQVAAAALLEATGGVGSEVIATPMDTESSVEVEVFLAMVAMGVDQAEANIVDLRSRIDEATAVAVRAAEQAGEAQAEITTLAEAIAAAQAAELRAYAEAGVTTSQSALFEAEVQASQILSQALHQGQNIEAAYAAFFEALVAAAESVGANAPTQSRAEASASISFRLVLEQHLDASAEADAIRQAALVHAAALEAWASSRAISAILEAANAAAELQDAARAAGETLVAEVSAAASTEAVAQAFAEFSAAIVGDASVTGSLLGTYLEVDATTAAYVDAAIEASWTAATEFDIAVRAAVSAALETGSAVDPNAVAQAVLDAWSNVRTLVSTAVTDNQDAFNSRADTSILLMLEATGCFRASTP